MSGKFQTATVYDMARLDWQTGAGLKFNKNYDRNTTYISIFGPDQLYTLKEFKENTRFKIIYEGRKAVNGSRNHGTLPRNTIVVWELASG